MPPARDPSPRTTYHWLRMRAIVHPTEDPAKVRQALRFVSGLDEAAFEGCLSSEPMTSHHGLPLEVLEATIAKSRSLRDVLVRILDLPGARDRLRATLESRVDDDGILYVRLGKQSAFLGVLELAEGGDSIQLRLKVEAYPAGRAAALRVLGLMLDAGRP